MSCYGRTDYCGNFGIADVGREVTVMGWVDSYRNLGSLLFVYLRDRTGTIQLTFDESDFADFAAAETLRNEFVISAAGTVSARAEKDINKNLATGEIEIRVNALHIFSRSETPPFEIWDEINVREELRLQYRYLDLRRSALQRNLIVRHQICKAARDYYASQGFLEIETPVLGKSTPEGARDYLVPSRVHPGTFYALPQSPQLFKQLLMMSGFDRYMQIAKCFRDEDLRADRQPEFTQIDLEMSFVDVDDVIEVNEGFLKYLFKEVLNVDLKTPFARLPYSEAMERYGSDKPDVRFGLELQDISECIPGCGFEAFENVVKDGGSVRAVVVPDGVAHYSRKEIDALQETVKTYGAHGLAWISMKEDGAQSSLKKFFPEDRWEALLSKLCVKQGDIAFIVAGKNKVVFDSLGHLRLTVADKLNLIPENTFAFLWVTDFPQFEYSEEEGRYLAMHHPFTCPKDESLEFIESDPGKVLAKAYDCVLNGNELGGGSIRIHTTELQERMLKALGFTHERAWNNFGFLLEALKFGAPPHGGLAFGLDRMVMLMTNTPAIRDVIAFPKVQNASDLMSGAPAAVDEKQLAELKIDLT